MRVEPTTRIGDDISDPPVIADQFKRTSATRLVRPAAMSRPSVEMAHRMRSGVRSRIRGTEAGGMRHDPAPVMCAVVLLHHDLGDEAIATHLAHTWPLDAIDCRAALEAAHILVRRGEPRVRGTGDT
jgi:hypothetical protein